MSEQQDMNEPASATLGTTSESKGVASSGSNATAAPSGTTDTPGATTQKASQATATASGTPQRSMAARAFDLLAIFPLLPLTILLVLQTMGGFDARALWFSDEVRHADVYQNVIDAGKWLVLQLNGVPYPDKPPVYFWFLAALDMIPGVRPPMLFLLGAAVSGLAVLWATYALARATGNDKATGLAAGLILLSGFYFLGVTHYARMDLLFTAVITLSHLCMYKGWRRESAPAWLIAGYALAAVATLIKGPLGLAFPVLSSVLFVLWQGKVRRLHNRDAVAGFAVMLVILLGWVAAAWMTGESEYLRNIFQDQIVKRATATWHHAQPWWHYLATFPAAWLPWTLLLLTAPWGRVLRNPVRDALDTRKPEGLGTAYLWISLFSGVALLSAVSIKIVIYLLPLFPILAIITARCLLRLPATNSRVFYLLVSLLLFILAVGLGGVAALPLLPGSVRDALPPQALALLDIVAGAPVLGGVCLIFALLLFKATDRSQPRGALLTLVLFTTVFVQPMALYTAPSLDPVMSPKAQAEIIGAHAKEGYHPLSYRVYPGTYTFYAGTQLEEITQRDWALLDAALSAHPRAVIAMRLDDWEQWPNRPASAREIQRQWIVDRQFVVVVTESAAPDAAAATPEGAPAPTVETPAAAGTEGHAVPDAAPAPAVPVEAPASPAVETPATPSASPAPTDVAPAPQPEAITAPGAAAQDQPALPAMPAPQPVAPQQTGNDATAPGAPE